MHLLMCENTHMGKICFETKEQKFFYKTSISQVKHFITNTNKNNNNNDR